MPATYDKLGLNFMYPENWKLIDDTESLPHVVTLEAPAGSCTWTVHAYPKEVDTDAILKESIETLEQTYDDLEIAPLEQSAGETKGQGIEAIFYCLDFLVRAKLLWLETENKKILLWTQAEDRDFDAQEIIFQAITVSMLRD